MAFAPTCTLTTPTAEHAASFALTIIFAKMVAYHTSNRLVMRSRVIITVFEEETDRSSAICLMNSPSRCRGADIVSLARGRFRRYDAEHVRDGNRLGGGPDPCAVICKSRNKAQQTKCLAACKACKGNTSRIGGSCGSHTC